jgi:hypothetical protein
MWKLTYFCCLLHSSLLCLFASKTEVGNRAEEGPSPPQSPEEALASFQVEPGLKIQLVAAEPIVQDPVVITFDEDGRLC